MLVISYFDDIYGPQILEIYPYQADQSAMQISSILSLLIDVASENEEDEWIFLYSDKNFSSQNLLRSFVNTEARGGLTDILISIILHPTHFTHLSAMAHGWSAIYQLGDRLEKVIEFEQTRPLIHDSDFTRFFQSYHNELRDQFQFFLESLEPSAHLIE